jgi:hypothetical protein
MYAWVERGAGLARYDLVGRTPDGSEVPIRAFRQLWPFDDARLLQALGRLHSAGDRAGLIEALGFVGNHYERSRRAGRNDAPPISHVRLYRSEWPRLDPWGRDVDAPLSRTLVAEAAARGADR